MLNMIAPDVMARPLRIQYPGAVYHVMNRGSSRQKVFLETRDYEVFINTIGELHNRWRVEVFAYCLMGNHYHVCLRTPEGNLARVMRHLDGLYTQRFNRLHRRDGALFRGRYKAILVDKDNYLAQVVRYIHLNPLGASLVREPQSYLWSSHRLYLRPKEIPKWLQIEEVMAEFENAAGFHSLRPSHSPQEQTTITNRYLVVVDEGSYQYTVHRWGARWDAGSQLPHILTYSQFAALFGRGQNPWLERCHSSEDRFSFCVVEFKGIHTTAGARIAYKITNVAT